MELLQAAYDDPAGVTACSSNSESFGPHQSRATDSDFDLRQFAHVIRYNAPEQRIEMHLRSRVRQTVAVRAAGLTVDFEPDETICTEACHKFRPEQICVMARTAGFRLAAQWIDQEWPFAESLLVVV